MIGQRLLRVIPHYSDFFFLSHLLYCLALFVLFSSGTIYYTIQGVLWALAVGVFYWWRVRGWKGGGHCLSWVGEGW